MRTTTLLPSCNNVIVITLICTCSLLIPCRYICYGYGYRSLRAAPIHTCQQTCTHHTGYGFSPGMGMGMAPDTWGYTCAIPYCLPATWKIHNVFHASLLFPYKETEMHGPNFLKPPPNLIGTEVKWIVSHQGTSGLCKYLTAWKGYPSSENTWEPESNL